MQKNKQVKIRKRLQGIVVAAKATNTISVLVESKYPHPLYKKIVTSHKKYMAHCEDSKVEVGDVVIIEEGKPKSKNKKFYFVKKVS